ncbi:MAG: glycosyltransferase [Phycisphaerales bacterium]|nr:MAG: glycosyltransferase [Phycisphaerales bacterium]
MSCDEGLPRISIVTPSYNQAKYLPETIESILNQDYPNLEYIIIDGGSTDGSVDIIKRYESHLAYWVSEKDSGQSEAINKGFRKSTGVLFNWINSDDILFPGALHRIAETFACHADASLIVGDNARSDQKGRIIRISAVPSFSSLSPRSWAIWVAQQSTFISSAVFRNVGGVREDLHCVMDAELYYRILTGGGELARANGLIGSIREHPEAKGAARRSEWGPERSKVFGESGVSHLRVEIARAKMRCRRLLDGSCLRSWLLLRKWKGKRAWTTQKM